MSNPTHGTKVTDPNAASIQEGTGPVASDSLAAQSSTFKSSNATEPLSVAGSNSTFANTDTSGASTLSSSANAPSRDDDPAKPYIPQNSSSTSGSNATSSAGVAPTYVNNQYNADGKAKGGEEGDFSQGLKNASFEKHEIGGKNDPGRAAVKQFALNDSKGSVGLAGVPKQEGDLQENPYEALGRNEGA